MPELPEVEIVKQSLNKKIKFKKIKKVVVRNRNLRFRIPTKFEVFLKNKEVKKIARFSKYIIIHLSGDFFCIIHLGMSGTIHFVNKKKVKTTNLSFYKPLVLPNKHNHVEIHFQDFKIVYNDPRRFGFFKLEKNKQNLIKNFVNYGPEPFNKSFNLKYLISYFKGKKKNIKNFLLDQKFVSGIGNIYANEILFFCKINPKKKAMNLNIKECKKIIYFSKLVLKKSIKKGGSSIRNFSNISGKSGSFQNEFKVYQRGNLNCLRHMCKGKIKKNLIGNRSIFFCNRCQK